MASSDLWKRVLNNGFNSSTPEEDIQFIRTANVLALAVLGFNFLLICAALFLPDHDVPAVFLVVEIMAFVFILGFYLLYSSRHYIAGGLLFAVAAGLLITGLRYLFGANAEFQNYMLVHSVAIMLITLPRNRGIIGPLLLFFLIWYLLLHLTLPKDPALGGLDEQLIEALASINLIAEFAIFAAFAGIYRRSSITMQKEIAKQRNRAEDLLLNILPREIADRLKSSSRRISDSFSNVTVIFADIVGFTQLASRLSSQELVGMLDEVFVEFDLACKSNGLEKIKTIGDAYMAVAGIPKSLPDHADRGARFALDLAAAMARVNKRRNSNLDVRIGIHSGPVVAGVIGQSKFAYDLWGDTVNIASRMESHSEPGRIQITSETQLFSQIQAIVVDISYNHMPRTNMFGHCCRHDADRTRAGNQHILADQVKGQGGMHRIAIRVKHRGHVIRNRVGNFENVAIGNC